DEDAAEDEEQRAADETVILSEQDRAEGRGRTGQQGSTHLRGSFQKTPDEDGVDCLSGFQEPRGTAWKVFYRPRFANARTQLRKLWFDSAHGRTGSFSLPFWKPA